MKLDVGCGNNPQGDVNVDLYIHDTDNHRDNGCDTLATKLIPNFVKADGLHLPFQSKTFNSVFCGQLIEHVPNPQQLFAELVRVCSGKLTVETVYNYGERFKDPMKKHWSKQHHISHFNRTWFGRIGRAYHIQPLRTYVLNYVYWPHEYITLLRLPYAIGADFAC